MAPAAESVTSEFDDRVREVPQKCLSSVKTSSIGRLETCCRNERVKEREAGPMPSETIKTRFRFLSFLRPDFVVYGSPVAGAPGTAGAAVELRCWRTTVRTMTAAVARKAQEKRINSREDRFLCDGRGAPWIAASSSSARRWESWEERDVAISASSGVCSDDRFIFGDCLRGNG